MTALPAEYAYLTEDERAMIYLLADPDALVPLTFREYIARVKPNYIWYEYADRLADVLQLVADGAMQRLLVFAPPRLGKSELVSKLFAPYYLYRHPERWVALTSYAAELAYTLSREARWNYLEMTATNRTGGQTEAVKHWETGRGGGLWAAGVRGPATGKGAHLFIIDDPIKDAPEAASELIQARNIEWNDAVVETRLEKNAARIVIQTRWHQKDLAGLLLQREYGDAPSHWHIVCFEAEKEPKGAYVWPPTCTVEPDWRQVGETVCPDRLTPESLENTKRRDPYVWSAMYQQRPSPKAGGMFKRWWFEVVPHAPHPSEITAAIRWWDQAATEGGGDYTAGVAMCRTKHDVYYITDVARGQWASGSRDARILQVAKIDGRTVRQGTAIDPGSAGKDTERAFRKMLDGWPLRTASETGRKEDRADPLASAARVDSPEAVAEGRVKLVAGAWNEAFLEEMAAFPFGTNDDQVDAVANAYNQLQKTPKSGGGFTPYLAR